MLSAAAAFPSSIAFSTTRIYYIVCHPQLTLDFSPWLLPEAVCIEAVPGNEASEQLSDKLHTAFPCCCLECVKHTAHTLHGTRTAVLVQEIPDCNVRAVPV